MADYKVVSYVTDSFDNEVVRLLQAGRVGLLPTDTIYGLSARALDKRAVERAHTLKGRGSNKPLIVLISSVKMLDLLSISLEQADIVKGRWPGALSVIFQTPKAPAWLQLGSQTLAVRLPDHSELQKLINQTGPIISTSANLQGQAPARTAAEAQLIFGNRLDFYVDEGQLNNLPSTLAVINSGQLKTVRQGAVKIS